MDATETVDDQLRQPFASLSLIANIDECHVAVLAGGIRDAGQGTQDLFEPLAVLRVAEVSCLEREQGDARDVKSALEWFAAMTASASTALRGALGRRPGS